jgi:hypothetical protein
MITQSDILNVIDRLNDLKVKSAHSYRTGDYRIGLTHAIIEVERLLELE